MDTPEKIRGRLGLAMNKQFQVEQKCWR